MIQLVNAFVNRINYELIEQVRQYYFVLTGTGGISLFLTVDIR